MGLLYMFPTDKNDLDHVIENQDQSKITLRSYGLPPIFWFYALASLSVLFLLYLAVSAPLDKIGTLGSEIDYALMIIVKITFIFLPIITLAYFFYEKNLIASNGKLEIVQKIFFMKFRSQAYDLSKSPKVYIRHFIDSPNIAKIKDEASYKAFQNKGYFELCIEDQKGREITIDRGQRKSDLKKISAILEEYLA